jgi:hypothetical protein
VSLTVGLDAVERRQYSVCVGNRTMIPRCPAHRLVVIPIELSRLRHIQHT